jgi:hypothetical protein
MNKTIRNTIAAAAVAASMLIGSAPNLRAQDASATLTPEAAIAQITEAAKAAGNTLAVFRVKGDQNVGLVRGYIAKIASEDITKVISFDDAVFFNMSGAATAYVVFWKDGAVVAQGPITVEQYNEIQNLLSGL